jgi:hypothetical protein
MRNLRNYPRQKINSTAVKILVDGNSTDYGVGASSTASTWPELLKGLAPLVGQNVTVQNLAVGGKAITNVGGNTNNLMADRTALINAMSSTAHNIAIFSEFINELRLNSINAQAAYDAFVTYCLTVKSEAAAANKKLSIIIRTTTPAGAAPDGQGQSWIDSRMAAITQCNQWMRTKYRDFADGISDVAMSPPFRAMYEAGIWTPAAFNLAGVYTRSDGQPKDNTHMGDSGNLCIAQPCALAITRVRVK